MRKRNRLGAIYGRSMRGLGGGLSGRSGFTEMFDYDHALRAAHVGFCEDGIRVYAPMAWDTWCVMRASLDDQGPPRSWAVH
jgi:hypothetical protein